VGLFSYGSGLCSSMYSLHISSNATPGSPLSRLIGNISHIKQLLDQRTKVSPEKFAKVMETREQNHHKGKVTCSYLLNQYEKLYFK
jgi:hydroxymethylglutaryl-CoA synthase